MTQDKDKSLVFLCSPSLGIIDSWISVIWEIKKQSSAKIILLAPKPRTILEVDTEDTVHNIADKLFDSIIYIDRWGGWNRASSLYEAKRKAKVANSIAGVLSRPWSTIRKCLSRQDIIGVLYDLYEESKEYYVPLREYFRDLPKFSMNHGCGIDYKGTLPFQKSYRGIEKELQKTSQGELGRRKDVIVYLYSHLQAEFYKKYNVDPKSYRLVGIPRHDADWMDYLRQESNTFRQEDFEKGFILVLSRPASSDYFPPARKRRALKYIKKVSIELGLRVVVKLHPKEWYKGKQSDFLYEEVFGHDGYGSWWMYSRTHPLILGEKALISFFFFSSTAADMVRISTPVIGISDMRSLPGFDHAEAQRDSRGRPVKGYRALGLCLGADDLVDVQAHVSSILKNKDEITERLSRTYGDIFPLIKGINKKMAKEIINCTELVELDQ